MHAGEHADERGGEGDAAQAAKQRGEASTGLVAPVGRQVGAGLGDGRQARAGPVPLPARSGSRRHHQRRPTARRRSAEAAPTWVGSDRRPTARRFGWRRGREKQYAAGRPAPWLGSGMLKQLQLMVEVVDGSTPCRSPKRRHALGARTAIHSRTTSTSRITIVTPRRPTFAS